MNWKKALVITFNVIIGIYLVLAVTAFNKPVEKDIVCSDMHIVIDKNGIGGFLTPDGVRRMLLESGLNPVGKALADVNLRQMEEKLEAQQLVDEAECYKTQDGKVCVRVKERVPVVRVMAQNGDDYYVDRGGKVLQNPGVACNLLVATGTIDRRFASRVLAPMGCLIEADKFWNSQIEQINVLADSTVEMVPRVGEHIIYLGRPVGVAKKLERLRKFYQYGLSQAGWNKYSRISVEFNNQIVCKKKK